MFVTKLKNKHNLTLISEYKGAHKPITFLCPNGHENTAMATNVIQRGYKCKECIHGRKVISKIQWNQDLLEKLQLKLYEGIHIEEIAKEFNTTVSAINNAVDTYKLERSKINAVLPKLVEVLDQQERILLSDLISTHSKIEIQCKNNHTVEQLPLNVIYKNTNCPLCYQKTSKPEKELLDFIKANYSGWIEENDRSILDGRELDIVLPDLGLAIEFNGTYWHSESHVSPKYHLDKTIEVEAFGFQLIHVNEYDWLNKPELVKSKILNLIKPQPRLGARKTIVKDTPWKEAKDFLEKYHIQGKGSPTSINKGLYYKDELVALATFKAPRFTKEYDLELIRYATSRPIQGGLGKLLKQVNYKRLVTYAQRDWSQGKIYKALGFKLEGYTEPGYAYYKQGTRVSRYQAQKHKLSALLETFDPTLSEYANMRANGYHRVWDTGNLVFSIDNPLNKTTVV